MVNELKVWAQYFAIALLTELGAFAVWFFTSYEPEVPHKLLYDDFQSFERPRLLPWLCIFIVLSVVRLVIMFLGRKRGGIHAERALD